MRSRDSISEMHQTRPCRGMMARTSRQRLVSRAAPAHVFAGVEHLRLGWELTSVPGSEHRGTRQQPVCRPRRDIPWTPMSQGCVPGVRMVSAALNLWKIVLMALFQGAPLATRPPNEQSALINHRVVQAPTQSSLHQRVRSTLTRVRDRPWRETEYGCDSMNEHHGVVWAGAW